MKLLISSLLLCLLSTFCFGQLKTAIPADIKGNWFKPGTNEWILGVQDSVIIYENKVWKFKRDENAKDLIILKLVNKTGHKTLYIKKESGQYHAGEHQSALKALSKTATKVNGKESAISNSNPAIFKNDSVTYQGYLQSYSPKLGLTQAK